MIVYKSTCAVQPACGCLQRQYLQVWHSRYVLDGFPKTLKQSELMGSRSIIPMIAVELELESVEVLQRGLDDKMKPNKSVMLIATF